MEAAGAAGGPALDGGYAQIATFAKCRPFADSGRSCRVRLKPDGSPTETSPLHPLEQASNRCQAPQN